MSRGADEQMAVFDDPAWRSDLARLAETTRVAARMYAADAFLLASLAERVPAPTGTGSGALAWQSFLQEVAVARGLQDRAAGTEVQRAVLLARSLPHTMESLSCGSITVLQALALADELAFTDTTVAREIDRRLAQKLLLLSPPRIRQETRRLVELLDADAAADRAARGAARRSVQVRAGQDGQAAGYLNGPAIPMTRWYLALTDAARALRQAGDPRGLDALRFDLVMGGFALDEAPSDALVAPPVAAVASTCVSKDDSDLPEELRSVWPAVTSASESDEARQLPLPSGPLVAAPLTSGAHPAIRAGAPPGRPGHRPPPDDPMHQAREAAARLLEAAHAAEDRARHRLAQVRAEHDRLVSLILRERLALSAAPPSDKRMLRPVQLLVDVPVTTLLGLSNEPGFLRGYGWIGAPQCRQLLPSAELRQACTDADGQVIDLAARTSRPDLTPAAMREALLRLATEAFTITHIAWQVRQEHDPTDAVAELVRVRDRYCDGPLGTLVSAAGSDLDHSNAHPDGPTAPWNLASRSRRTHRLKHSGWTPIGTPDSVLWTSPAGQLTRTPRHQHPADALDPGATLVDPDRLHDLEAELLTPDDDGPDW